MIWSPVQNCKKDHNQTGLTISCNWTWVWLPQIQRINGPVVFFKEESIRLVQNRLQLVVDWIGCLAHGWAYIPPFPTIIWYFFGITLILYNHIFTKMTSDMEMIISPPCMSQIAWSMAHQEALDPSYICPTHGQVGNSHVDRFFKKPVWTGCNHFQIVSRPVHWGFSLVRIDSRFKKTGCSPVAPF